MERVEDIEAAIESLPPKEFRRIAQWVVERDQTYWDQQLDHDSCTGKLDFLFEEGESDSKEGCLASLEKSVATR